VTGDAADAKVVDVSYEGQGCSISQASTSVLTDLVVGKPVAEALAVYEAFLALMQSKGHAGGDEDLLEDAVAFVGVSRYRPGSSAALLGWMAWRDATARALATLGGAVEAGRSGHERG